MVHYYSRVVELSPYMEFLVTTLFTLIVLVLVVLISYLFYTLFLDDMMYNIRRKRRERKEEKRLKSLEGVINGFKVDETLNENFKSSKYRKYMLKSYLLNNGVNDTDLDTVTDILWKYFTK